MVVPISRFMIRLLVGDRVADLCRPGAGELAYRGCLVDLGDRDGAHGIDHAADDPAACGILDVAHLAIDGQSVAHLEAVLGADIDDEGAVGGNVGHHAVDLHNLDGGGRQRRRLLIQTVSHIGGRLGDSRAQNGVPEVGTPHIEAAPTRIAPASTRSHNARAAARLFAVALHAGQDLGGGRVDHARRNGTHSRGLGGLDAAPPPTAVLLSSRPNCVMLPTMMASTPRMRAILAALAGSARSLLEKFCSLMILSSCLRSMTE